MNPPKTVDHGEQGRFASSVRPDDTEKLSLVNIQRHVSEGHMVTITDTDPVD